MTVDCCIEKWTANLLKKYFIRLSIFCSLNKRGLPVWCETQYLGTECEWHVCSLQYFLRRHHSFSDYINVKINVVKINRMCQCIKFTTFYNSTASCPLQPANRSWAYNQRAGNLFSHLTTVPGPVKSLGCCSSLEVNPQICTQPDKLLSVIYGSVSVSGAPVLGDFYTLLWQLTTQVKLPDGNPRVSFSSDTVVTYSRWTRFKFYTQRVYLISLIL